MRNNQTPYNWENAPEWWPGAESEHLPITVNRHIAANGRQTVKVFGNDGVMLHSHG